MTPCIEVLHQIYKEKYTLDQIEDNVSRLFSSGILEPYSFHAYLDLAETFKSEPNYLLLKKELNKE